MLLPRGQSPLKLIYSIMSLNTISYPCLSRQRCQHLVFQRLESIYYLLHSTSKKRWRHKLQPKPITNNLGIIDQFHISDGIGSCNGEEEMFSLKYHTKGWKWKKKTIGLLAYATQRAYIHYFCSLYWDWRENWRENFTPTNLKLTLTMNAVVIVFR